MKQHNWLARFAILALVGALICTVYSAKDVAGWWPEAGIGVLSGLAVRLTVDAAVAEVRQERTKVRR